MRARAATLARVATGFVAACAAVLSLAGSNCDGLNNCDCFPCTSAIDLQTFDADGNALTDPITVEATVDGVNVDDVVNCDNGARFGNECTFGQAPGVYRITIRADGFQTLQVAARFAAKSGEDCCRCLGATAVHAVLLPGDGGQ